MQKQKYLFSGILFLLVLLATSLAVAQSSPQKDEGGARIQGRAGDHNFDVQVQGGESRREASPPREAPDNEKARPGPQGPQGPQGTPGPQGPAGPSGGTVLGM